MNNDIQEIIDRLKNVLRNQIDYAFEPILSEFEKLKKENEDLKSEYNELVIKVKSLMKALDEIVKGK